MTICAASLDFSKTFVTTVLCLFITVQLLQKLVIRATNGPDKLMKVVKQPVTRHLPIGARRIGMLLNSLTISLGCYIQLFKICVIFESFLLCRLIPCTLQLTYWFLLIVEQECHTVLLKLYNWKITFWLPKKILLSSLWWVWVSAPITTRFGIEFCNFLFVMHWSDAFLYTFCVSFLGYKCRCCLWHFNCLWM